MGALSVRNLPPEIHKALRIRAAHNERSVEAEVREILTQTLAAPAGAAGVGTLLQRFGEKHGGIQIAPRRCSAATGAERLA